jgi:acetyltransferase-like isoleucine patch superfamily enzyme
MKIRLTNKGTKIGFASLVDNTSFEGHNFIGKFSSFRNSNMGFGSYIGDGSHLSSTSIGRYTSIADNVRLVVGRHPVKEFISTHPAFYTDQNSTSLQYVKCKKYKEVVYAKDNYLITIGNDVWIGSDAAIIQGVKIGDGAIVACGAIVTHDVQPYSVVAGVPAKVIKYRFDNSQIRILKQTKWWDWPENIIAKRAKLFENPDDFFRRCTTQEWDD